MKGTDIMKKFKRLAALAGAVLLIILYACTLIFSLMDGALAAGLFKASIYCTVAVPVLLYAIMLIYRVLKGRGNPSQKNDPARHGSSKSNSDTNKSGNSR